MTLLDDSSVEVWTDVCAYDDLLPERGVAAFVDGGQVAIFRLHDGALHALGQRDPFSGAHVMSRGIVGSRTVDGGPVPTVASPMFKQVFDLRTGACLDDDERRLPVFAVRQREGRVEIGLAVRGST